MFEWSDMRIALAAQRAGSITRAAADLRVSVSTVSRRLAALEADLGIPLFSRTPDGLLPTEAGARVLDEADRVALAVQRVEAAVVRLKDAPEGLVRLAAPADIVNLVLAPGLPELFHRFPGVRVQLRLRATVASVLRSDTDLAVLVQRPPSSDELVGQRVRSVGFSPFAASRYLAGLTQPDLKTLRWIGMPREPGPIAAWLQAAVPDADVRLEVADLTAMRLACASGAGVALLPSLFGQLTPGLVELPWDAEPALPSLDLWLVCNRAVRSTPAVEVVRDFVVAMLTSVRGQDDLFVLRNRLGTTPG
jgi:DNA-binding transcriptional LysR family regulator